MSSNTKLYIPGGYGQIILEATSNRDPSSTTVGIVGPANGGIMDEPLSFFSPESALETIGRCATLDMMNSIWNNGGGEIVLVRVGSTKKLDGIWMDNVTEATDLTATLSRQYGRSAFFDTGSSDWLYLGRETQFDNIYFDLFSAAAFSSASVALQAEYWDGSAWSSLTVSDGTVSGSKTMALTGSVTFTAPADWTESIPSLTNATASYGFWIRVRPAEVPTTEPLANMIAVSKNALPAWGLLVAEESFTGEQTSVASQSFSITAVNIGTDKFTVAGDKTAHFPTGALVTVAGSTGNDGDYTVASSIYTGGNTEITVDEDVTNAVADGTISSYAYMARTTVKDSGETFTTRSIEVGDVCRNVTDGSEAEVISVDSNTQVTTTPLTGGVLNRYLDGATVVASGATVPDALVDTEAVTATESVTGGTVITVPTANFLTARVTVGDVAQNITTPANSGVVVSIISATKLLVTGTWAIADSLDVYSTKILQDLSHNFGLNGVRPGTTIDFGANGTALVTALLDYDEETGTCYTILTDGLSGGAGTHFVKTYQYGYTVAADTYEFVTPTEKAYLEAKEWGAKGNQITAEVYQVGTMTRVKITYGSYIEEYEVLTAATEPLLDILTQISENADSIIGVVEDLTNGVYDLPSSMPATAFTGGVNGSASDNEYAEGFDALLNAEQVGVVCATTYNDAINAAIKDHVGKAIGLDYQLPRIGICCKPENENFLRVSPALQTEAQEVAYDGLIQYVTQRLTVRSLVSASGLTSSRAAFAAAYAGRLAKTPAAQTLSGQPLNGVSLDKVFNRADKTTLIKYGILIADMNANGISIVRSVTPSVGTLYYEVSRRRAVNLTEQTVRTELASLYVGKLNERNILDQVAASTQSILNRLLSTPGSLGGTIRDFGDVRASFNAADDTRIDVSYRVVVLSPINFIFTTIHVHSSLDLNQVAN